MVNDVCQEGAMKTLVYRKRMTKVQFVKSRQRKGTAMRNWRQKAELLAKRMGL